VVTVKVWVLSEHQGDDDYGTPFFYPTAVYATEQAAADAALAIGRGPYGEPAPVVDEFEVKDAEG
jgi:hypothetical protein